MNNITKQSAKALSLRLRMSRRHGSLSEALSPFKPTGWCGGILSGRTGAADFDCAGEAVLGQSPMTEDTVFRVASISKVFGAAAAIQLVRDGKLALDIPAAEVLGFGTGRTITLRQLITHTAGLDDRPIYDKVVGTKDAPTMDIILPKSHARHEPGTCFRYSNLGAGVVGMMVEAASGMIFDDYVCQQFFTPFGIDASFHPQRIERKAQMANCYRVPGSRLCYDAHAIAKEPLDETPNPRLHYAVPAGKLMISAPDLAKALLHLTRWYPELFVRQDAVGSVRCDAGRGLGVAIMPRGIVSKERFLWGHQGVAYGALCEAWIDRDDETVAVWLSNGARLSAIGPLYMAGQTAIATLLDQADASRVY